MGYSYGRNERGNMVLSCDNCGELGGVRKRECRYTVLGDSLRTVGGHRHRMNYCYPPALCGACYTARGGSAGIHGEQCKTGAAAMQAHYDEIEQWLDAGELLVISASSPSAYNDIPAGMVRVTFKGRAGEATRDMPADAYDFRNKPRLSDYDAPSHEYSAEPDARYPHLVRGHCSCGWHTAGYMAGYLTSLKFDQHVAAESVAA